MPAKRISYRDAVDFIAWNDGWGDDDAFKAKWVAGLTTVVMLAHVSGREPLDVAKDVVALRLKDREEAP